MNRADFYDAELSRHNAHFEAALKIERTNDVLDIGCGSGQAARYAARVAVDGSVVGVDISDEMLQIARRRSAEQGLRNVAFELGDAQVLPFAAERFDVCISRFGTMFFADPAAAFGNIARAMRRGARLVLLVWQSHDRNAWATTLQETLPHGVGPSPAGAAFSLGDRAVTEQLLSKAGFISVDFDPVREPVFYGPDVDAAYDAVAALFPIKDPDAAADAACRRLRSALQAHATAQGVLFDSRAWIVTAVRR